MRLIDADKLPYVDKIILADKVDGDIVIAVAKKHTSYVNDETPTVEAIPIEWIKKYIENHTYETVNPKYVDDTYNYIEFTEPPVDYMVKLYPYQVESMLKSWEKEVDNDKS